MRLVFTSAYAMPKGFQPTDGGEEQMPWWVKVDFEVGICSFNSSSYVDCFFFSLFLLFY